ncbi:MAG: hypothetical protein KDE58_12480 [Caldilineaceae bacterium]|nr:hypothetical protein [Caldilineaceae bacterium]
MFDPFEAARNGRTYYEERNLDARNYRPVQINGEQITKLVQRAGDFLIAAGQKLKGEPQSATTSLAVAEEKAH